MSNDIEKYRKIYDETYQNIEHYNYYDEVKNAYVDTYAAFISGPMLDAGCGEGIHLKRLLKKHYDVFGIELSKVCCERYLKDAPHQNMDIVSFARQGRTFNGAICMDVLEHIPPESLDETIEALVKLSPSALLGVANHSDVLNGVELHLIREDSSWWIKKLEKYYSKVTLLQTLYDGRFFLLDCSNQSTAIYEEYAPKCYELMQYYAELQRKTIKEKQEQEGRFLQEKQVLINENSRLNRQLQDVQQQYKQLTEEYNKVHQDWMNLSQENQILLYRYRYFEKFRFTILGRALRWLRRLFIS